MAHFEDIIKKHFAQIENITAPKRQALYQELRKRMYEELEQIDCSEEEKQKQFSALEKAITKIENEYALLNKVLEKKTENKKTIKFPIKENQLQEKKEDLEEPEKIQDNSSILESFQRVKEKITLEKIRQQRRKGAYLIALLSLAFISILWISSAFITSKTTQKSFIKFDPNLQYAATSKKNTYRLLGNGNETIEEDENKDLQSKSDPQYDPYDKGIAFYSSETSEGNKSTLTNGNIHWDILPQKHPGAQTTYQIYGHLDFSNKMDVLITFSANTNKKDDRPYFIKIAFVPKGAAKDMKITSLSGFELKNNLNTRGYGLSSATLIKISDNFFVYSLQNTQPFLDNDLEALKNTPYFTLIAKDDTGEQHIISFSKGLIGRKAFQNVLGRWRDKEAQKE